jgi:type IV secretory pathway TraG/TraD family ATPase VirD4
VTTWANEAAHVGNTVSATLAKILTQDGADPEDAAAYEAFNATYVQLRDGGDGERSAVWNLARKTLAPFNTASVQASTNPQDNIAMVDTLAAVTVPYSVLYIVMPAKPSTLESMRAVFTAFLEELLDVAVDEAHQYDEAEPRLPAGLQLTVDELQTTRCLPKLPAYLDTFRKMNIKILFLTQSFSGLASGYSRDQMDSIRGGCGAVLTYGGYGLADEHIKGISEEIGARTVTRVSKSKRGGEDAGESSSKERVLLVDSARLLSEVHADKMIIQTAGPTSGTAADKEMLRPFIGRQHRAAASDEEKAAGWWVDPVTFARLEKGTAEGVVAQDRPSDRRWVRPIQRLYRSLAARLRRPQPEPATA